MLLNTSMYFNEAIARPSKNVRPVARVADWVRYEAQNLVDRLDAYADELEG